jgi:hypothetical protein
MFQVYQESEVYETLGEVVKYGAAARVMSEAYKLKNDRVGMVNSGPQDIRSVHLKNILMREGNIGDIDANKVILMIEVDGVVSLNKFEHVLNQTKLYIRDHSDVIRRLRKAISENGRLIISKLEGQDYNKDGVLNVDGFKAALRIPEVPMRDHDLDEAYNLICTSEDGLFF